MLHGIWKVKMHKCERLGLTCYENVKGELWLSNDIYEQWRVNCCPFCGKEAKKKLKKGGKLANEQIIRNCLEDLDRKYKEQVHPKYENVGFTISKAERGYNEREYKIRWEKETEEDLDYWKHEILMDSSYPIDPDSSDFTKINVHNPDNNCWIIKTTRPLRVVQVRVVYY